jgi:cell division protein FtsZ
MRFAEAGIAELHKVVDTLLIIPNQNLFRVANEKTTFADAFAMADQVLYSGVACITDLMVKEGLINLDFADVRAVMREMGKAMMGTGEASGEKRALRAAEAAISNPLIDDVSMRGARGLLISITGGKDLTLYEVDEAATRIREEVDQDANIIVGATFDETLEGIIRVSVVATGVDEGMVVRHPVGAAATPRIATPVQASAPAPTAHENRIAELTQRLRADSQRLAERLERNDSGRPAAGAPTSAPPANQAAIESVATAAVAAALEDVTIRPIPPKPSLFEPTTNEPPVAEPDVPKVFIPPQPERPVVRAPRMPRIDELPIPAQNELRARRGEPVETEPVEKRRMSLLQRLAAVGLGRREEAEEVDQEPEPSVRQQLPPLPERPPQRPIPRAGDSREPVSEYAKRTPQGLDQHGRQAPVNNLSDDDQLDIPAFLRRQAT